MCQESKAPLADEPESLELAEIPFDLLEAQDPATLERLTQVCETLGFFVITGHPLPVGQLEEAFAAYRAFFAKPEAEKRRFHQSEQTVEPKNSRGYTALFEERLGAPYLPEDYKQVLDLGIDRAAVAGEPFTGRNVAPTDADSPNFSAVLRLQAAVLARVYWPVVRAFAAALGLPAAGLDAQMTDPTLIQRAVFYPARKGAVQPHTDSALFTLLFLEAAGDGGPDRSLEVLSQGRWRRVAAGADKIVVNLGDHFQLWSAGRFVSTLHRVHHTGADTRVSMPWFFYPNINATFVPAGKTAADTVRTRDVAVGNFTGIWKEGQGTGRELTAQEKEASLNG